MAVGTIGRAFQAVWDQVTQKKKKKNYTKLKPPAATIEEAFQELLDQVTQGMEKNKKIKPVLASLEAMLNCVKDDIIQSHQMLHDQNKVIKELHRGAKLVAKVSKLGSGQYNIFLNKYTSRLLTLEQHLRLALHRTVKMNRAYQNTGTTVPLTEVDAQLDVSLVRIWFFKIPQPSIRHKHDPI